MILKLCPPPSRGKARLVLGRASLLYEGHLFRTKYERKVKYVYFGRHFAWLKYITYRLVPVPAPNYKHRTLSPAKVMKIFYSISWTSCKICLFEFIRVVGGAKFTKHFKGGRKLQKFGNLCDGPWWWRQYAPPKRRSTSSIHGAIYKKTVIFMTAQVLDTHTHTHTHKRRKLVSYSVSR
jgi:hypothetical protein